MPQFDGTPYTQLTTPARGDIQGVIKDVSEALPENQTKFAAFEDLLKYGAWASKVRSVTASGAVTLADTDPIFVEINPNGSDRDVNFPAKSDDNHGYFVRHSGGANTLTLKRSGGATITTLAAGEAKYIMPSTLNDFSALAAAAAGLSAASQAEQETGTSTAVAVTPGRQQYHASAAKAWVNFNGTGTVAIRKSHNVSSITDNGTGDYTVNFTVAFSDANYCVVRTSSYSVTGSGQARTSGNALSVLAASYRFLTVYVSSTAGDGVAEDQVDVNLAFFGDQ